MHFRSTRVGLGRFVKGSLMRPAYTSFPSSIHGTTKARNIEYHHFVLLLLAFVILERTKQENTCSQSVTDNAKAINQTCTESWRNTCWFQESHPLVLTYRIAYRLPTMLETFSNNCTRLQSKKLKVYTFPNTVYCDRETVTAQSSASLAKVFWQWLSHLSSTICSTALSFLAGSHASSLWYN